MLDFLTKKKPVVEAPAMQTPMPEGAAHAQLDKPDLMSVADAKAMGVPAMTELFKADRKSVV